MRKLGWFLTGLIGLTLLVILWMNRQQEEPLSARLQVETTPVDLSGFSRANGPYNWSFPADFGPHPDYQTEWWYYTGNLATPQGRRFGYQLTFFRRAISAEQPAGVGSDWRSRQVYMAHFAITDVAAGEHRDFERLSRGAADLAGASGIPYQVWLDDWQVKEIDENTVRLQAASGSDPALVLDLVLVDRKGPILQGDQGYSRKGELPGQASYYYSQTRLETSGTLQVGESVHNVAGWSWKDHEFSTSVLSRDQVGWDWFALQLEDGRDLMVFQIRRADGSIDPYSNGAIISPGGEVQRLAASEFSILATGKWKSPRSGADYPSGWLVRIPEAGLDLEVTPLLVDQEMNGSYAYWEGAVTVRGLESGRTGAGYVELTGYADTLGGEF